MAIPTVHLTEAYEGGVFYPACPASNCIARAFDIRHVPLPALVALQDLGVAVVIDGEPQSYLGHDVRTGGLAPIGAVVARRVRNQKTGE